ncbi:MAG: hypothetical protein RLZZ546_2643 [Bacteroidota bacterium]|jgi:hypothetical protein
MSFLIKIICHFVLFVEILFIIKVDSDFFKYKIGLIDWLNKIQFI